MGSSVSSGLGCADGEVESEDAPCHVAAWMRDAQAVTYFDYKVVKMDLYACWLLPGYLNSLWEVPMTAITYTAFGRTLEHMFVTLTADDGSIFVVQYGTDGYSIVMCKTEEAAMKHGQGPHGEPWLRRSQHVNFAFVEVVVFCREEWEPEYGLFHTCQDFAEQLWKRCSQEQPCQAEAEKGLEDALAFIREAMDKRAAIAQAQTELQVPEPQASGTSPRPSVNAALPDRSRAMVSPCDSSCSPTAPSAIVLGPWP